MPSFRASVPNRLDVFKLPSRIQRLCLLHVQRDRLTSYKDSRADLQSARDHFVEKLSSIQHLAPKLFK